MAASDRSAATRIVFWRIDFGAAGPGVALAQILAERPNTTAMAQVIAGLAPDIVVLSGVDYDMQDTTLTAFRNQIAAQGRSFPHLFAPVPNAGIPSGYDLNGDGIRNGPDDAHGYGPYAGARSLAVLSQHPIAKRQRRDFSSFLWRDLPNAKLYTDATPQALARHRLSSVAHLELPVRLPGGAELRLLIYHAGPPAFGNHPDRNRNRNHDETAFWLRLLNDELPLRPPRPPFVLVGDSNLDPFDGDGLNTAMRALLAHPTLQDPQPASRGAALQSDLDHVGPAALDTVTWDHPPGNLRVSYVLPSADLRVVDAGVLWPPPDDSLAAVLDQTGTRHKPVWVDVDLN